MKKAVYNIAKKGIAVVLAINTKFKINKLVKKNEKINLEIGAGAKKGKNGWITLDLNRYCDLSWDLRNGIPFPDNTVNIIYSSHLFEHLTFKQINVLMQESKRVLTNEGFFSICIPNARPYLEAYVNKDDNFWIEKPSYYEPSFNNTTRIDIINYVAYMNDEHKYMFDEENILYILNQNGFKNAKIRSFDPEIDIEERRHESIYAIAQK